MIPVDRSYQVLAASSTMEMHKLLQTFFITAA